MFKKKILDALREKFSTTDLWGNLEFFAQTRLVDLPEEDSVASKKQVIRALTEIYDWIIQQGIDKKELMFLKAEIDHYKRISMISLYKEEDSVVREEDVELWAKKSFNEEGVIGIYPPYNYVQIKKLIKEVYKKTGLVKFFISDERAISGKIMGKMFEYPKEIPIVSLCISKRKEDKGDKYLFVFGEKINKQDFEVLREITVPFYIYRFVSDTKNEYIVLFKSEVEVGDYVVNGVLTTVNDYSVINNTKKLMTKLPIMFALGVESKNIKFKDVDDFFKKLDFLNINKDNFMNYPFTFKTESGYYYGLYPEWFKWLIMSWLFHAEKGITNKYPFHILFIGPRGTGKSSILNALYSKSREVFDIFTGETSTLKKLIPSFKGTPKPGYLVECSRFAFLDEFLRIFVKKRGNDAFDLEESIAGMNSLLEHQKREAGSGIGSIRVNMRARAIAVTNPVKAVGNVLDLANKFDESFLSRWIIYWQDPDFIKLINEATEEDFSATDFWIKDEDFVNIVDFLQSFDAKYDLDEVKKVVRSFYGLLPEKLLGIYKSRYMHHATCLLDGIIKTRCLFERDKSFSALGKDYEMFGLIWGKIMSSWVVNLTKLKELPVSVRLGFLSSEVRDVYDYIDEKRPSREQLVEYFRSFGNKIRDYAEILFDAELIKVDEMTGNYVPYWWKRK